MEKIVYGQMLALRELPQQMPPPPSPAKARMQKPQGGGKFLVQIPGGARGMVMDHIDTYIILHYKRGNSSMEYIKLPHFRKRLTRRMFSIYSVCIILES